MFRPSVLALFSSQPSSRGQGVEVRIVEFFARRLGQSVGEIFAVRRPSEGGDFENRLRLKKILMCGGGVGEFRTARNCDAAPNGLRNPADVRSVRQIARKTGPERANEYKPFESRASIEEIARRHSPTHGLQGYFGVGKKRLRLQARIGEPPQGLCKLRASFRRRRPDAPLFNDHRRRHAGPVAIVTERLEKLAVALVLRVFQATPDPDLGVIVRALWLITLRPNRSSNAFRRKIDPESLSGHPEGRSVHAPRFPPGLRHLDSDFRC